jgi:hypothetical protein
MRQVMHRHTAKQSMWLLSLLPTSATVLLLAVVPCAKDSAANTYVGAAHFNLQPAASAARRTIISKLGGRQDKLCRIVVYNTAVTSAGFKQIQSLWRGVLSRHANAAFLLHDAHDLVSCNP